MKVAILSSSDLIGGAARAAYRIHQSLSALGVDITMLVQKKVSDDNSVICPNNRLDKLRVITCHAV